MQPLRIGIVAAEPSGDLLAAGLMDALRELPPGVQFEGVCRSIDDRQWHRRMGVDG